MRYVAKIFFCLSFIAVLSLQPALVQADDKKSRSSISKRLSEAAKEKAASEEAAERVKMLEEEAKKRIEEQDLNVNDEIRRCSEFVSRVDRLLCFDELSASLGFITAEQADREEVIIEKVGFWVVAKKRNAIGENIIYLRNDSIEPIVSYSGLTRHPTLIIKCKHGSTEVYLDWKKKMLAVNRPGVLLQDLAYQFDANELVGDKWELSLDRQAIFHRNPVNFVRDMREHDRIIFQLTPMNDKSYTIVHDISGLNTVLKVLVEECYK